MMQVEPGLESRVPVTRLTHVPNRCVLAYYTDCPLSVDGTKLVYFQYEQANVDRRLPERMFGRVVTANPDGTQPSPGERVFAAGVDGVMAHWCGPTHRIAHHLFAGEGKWHWRIIDADTGDQWTGPDMMRQASPDGRYLFLQTGEMIHLDAQARGQTLSPEQVAARVIDYQTGSEQARITVADVLKIHPDAEVVRRSHMIFKQTLFSPEGRHLAMAFSNAAYVTRQNPRPEEPYRHELLLADRDGGSLSYLGPLDAHPSWHPDGQRFCALVKDPQGRTAFGLFPVDGGAVEYWHHPTLRSGHPSIQLKHHRYLINDHFDPQRGVVELVLYRLSDWSSRVLLRARCGDYSNETGTHLHPSWHHDGQSIYFNSAHLGWSQLYRADLNETIEAELFDSN